MTCNADIDNKGFHQALGQHCGLPGAGSSGAENNGVKHRILRTSVALRPRISLLRGGGTNKDRNRRRVAGHVTKHSDRAGAAGPVGPHTPETQSMAGARARTTYYVKLSRFTSVKRGVTQSVIQDAYVIHACHSRE